MAVADTVTVLPDIAAPAPGAVIFTAVAVLLTVMLTGVDVTVPLAESVATAVSVCAPLDNFVASSVMLYGVAESPSPN